MLGPPGGFFDSTVIKNSFPNLSAGAVKAAVNRALSKKEIYRLRPGLYCLIKELRKSELHPFVIAGMLRSPSYISLESALSYHGLIPEAVYQVSCITSARSKLFQTPLGNFSFHKIPSNSFRAGVKAVEFDNKMWAFIAEPLRAIADLVYLRKEITWKEDHLDFLTQSLRIEPHDLSQLSFEQFDNVLNSIRNKRTRRYLLGLKSEFQ